MWGLLPLYWRQLNEVPPLEVLGHRIIWTALLTGGLLVGTRGFAPLWAILSSRRKLLATAAASVCISSNGLMFIWAVSEGRVTEVSLGYYINPLFNVLLGVLVLGERPRPLQWVAIALAASGVIYFTLELGALPWVSLVLALCFGLYGLIRKAAPVAPLEGLCVEMSLASPLALAGLALIPAVPFGAAVSADAGLWGLLIASGVASALPLYLFAYGARRLPYSTLGLLMYLAPTLQLGLAVFAFGEPFKPVHGVTFALIWAGITLYLVSGARRA